MAVLLFIEQLYPAAFNVLYIIDNIYHSAFAMYFRFSLVIDISISCHHTNSVMLQFMPDHLSLITPIMNMYLPAQIPMSVALIID